MARRTIVCFGACGLALSTTASWLDIGFGVSAESYAGTQLLLAVPVIGAAVLIVLAAIVGGRRGPEAGIPVAAVAGAAAAAATGLLILFVEVAGALIPSFALPATVRRLYVGASAGPG